MTNPAFNNFLDLPESERDAVFRVTREKLDMPLVLIEKDLWTCHVLDALFNNVITHAQRLFRRGWMKLDQIATDGIKLVPQDDLYGSLEADYQAMREMLFGDIPSFSTLIDHIGVVEKQFNHIILN